MSNPTHPSYRPNLNRNVTKKWAEAQQVNYGGDDWGDEDDDEDYGRPEPEPVSAGPQRHPGWGQRGGESTQRSFTNPAQFVNTGRQSFDRDEERRHFSTGTSEPRYQTQPSVVHSQQYGQPEPLNRDQSNMLPLQVNTKASGHAPQSSTQMSSRANPRTDGYGVPHSAPVGFPSQRSQPDNRAAFQDAFHTGEARQDQQHEFSGGSTTLFTPRGSSLSQQQGASGFTQSVQPETVEQPYARSQLPDTKPLPFIRPADIYKRIEEEREKERRSQESSRPSMDSSSGVAAGTLSRAVEVQSLKSADLPITEGNRTEGMQPSLNPITETKDEFAMSPTSASSERSSQTASKSNPISGPASATTGAGSSRGLPSLQRISGTTSSNYTDRPEPIAASSTGGPLPAANTSGRSPIADSFRQGVPQYSPSTRKLAILHSEPEPAQSDDDLPNFGYAISPSHSMTSNTAKTLRSDSLQTGTASPRLGSAGLQQHAPSGSKSGTQQALESEDSSRSSSSTTSDRIPQPSNTSTSKPNPIMERKSELRKGNLATPGAFPKTIHEEPTTSQDHTGLLTTIHPAERSTQDTILPAKTFVPAGNHRGLSPSVESIGARRPLSVEIPKAHDTQGQTTSNVTSASDLPRYPAIETLPSAQPIPTRGREGLHKQSTSQTELVPPATSRTASEDYREWQAQRRHFNETHGLEDSTAASPAISSPVSRSESPAKGTVRDIADRLENNPGRSSPIDVGATDSRMPILNKPLNSRNESFRPALPGGWQSYTTNTSSNENSERIDQVISPPQHPLPPFVHGQARTESTESIPTATAWQSSKPSPMATAFAAATAAGTAMAGAFSSSGLSRNAEQYSDSDGDSEVEESSDVSHQPETSQPRDFAIVSPKAHTQAIETPSPKLGNSEVQKTPQSVHDKSIDVPAPLRMNKTVDSKQPSPRLSIPQISSRSVEHDPEQLQLDIVQSLTPKTSSTDSPINRGTDVHPTLGETIPILPRRLSTESDGYDELAQENNSYWGERQTPTRQVEHIEHPTIEMPMIDNAALEKSNVERSFLDKPLVENVLMEEPTIGRLASEKPMDTNSTSLTSHPPIPVTSFATDDATLEHKPFLEQRYSWETGDNERDRDAEPAVSSTTKGVNVGRSSPPAAILDASSSTVSPPTPIVDKADGLDDIQEDQSFLGERDLRTPPLPSRPVDVSSFPVVKTDFRDILNFKDPSQRIRAFDENRQTYAQPNGLLNQWLSSMNTQEHADVFGSTRLPQAQPRLSTSEMRPSPRRDLTSASGTKQMQEDGKRLLAAAGKYGGKAGVVAKGFFAKQKDKLRTVSSGEKVPTRRTYSNVEINTSVPPSPGPVFPERAPQLPTPALETPLGEGSWSMLSSKIDQMFADRTQPSSADLSGSTLSSGTSRYQGTSAERPPLSVVAALPGDNKPAPKSAVFPNYNVGAETHRDPSSSNRFEQSFAASNDTLPRTGGDNFRFSGPPRIDSLPVPRQRRPSTISDVSEISAVPDEANEVVPRNVSPALDSQSRNPRASLISPQLSRKEEEAQRNRASVSEATPPVHNSAQNETNVRQQPRVTPGAQILPVADLKQNETSDARRSVSRPFSFVESETLNHALAQQAGLHSQPRMADPNSNTTNAASNFEKSPEPTITEHPAYKDSDSEVTTPVPENPLPSSRRPLQESDQVRQNPQSVVPHQAQPAEGYRIPGPYVQEYRSPRSSKPTLGQEPNQPSYENVPQSQISSNNVANRLPDHAAGGGIRDPMPRIEQRPTADRSKSRSFGSIFRQRSRSQSRDRPYDTRTQESDYNGDEGKRRRGLFGLSNRSSSPSRQLGDGRNEHATRPDAGRSRKLSFDMLRPSNQRVDSQTDTRRKRSSGLGALFGRSGDRERERERERDDRRMERTTSIPVSHNPQQHAPYDQSSYNQSGRIQTQQPTSVVEHRNTDLATQQESRPQQLQQPQHMQHLQQTPQQSQYSQNAQNHASSTSNQFGTSTSAYQQPSNQYGNPEPQLQRGQFPSTEWQSTPSRLNAHPTPSSNMMGIVQGGSSTYHAPAETSLAATSVGSSVPVTRANKDISYGQDRPYIPPTSPISGSGSPPVQNRTEIADHVKNLHKRSRSPRLGRPSSDEHLRGARSDINTTNSPGHRLTLDPVNQLGVFQNRQLSPVGGIPRSNEEQEKPWTIGLPDNGDDRNSNVDGRGRGDFARSDATTPSQGVGNNNFSSSTPYQTNQRDGTRGTTAPATAVEPNRQNMHSTAPVSNNPEPIRSSYHQPQHPDTINTNRRSQIEHTNVPEQLPVPPSISSAPVIPDPRSQHEDDAMMSTANSRTSTSQPHTSIPRATRSVKRVTIEEPQDRLQSPVNQPSRPLTVAERIMGVQPAARGTVPEHRSTTPVSGSSMSSVGAHAKTTTWPDERANTTAMATTTTPATIVTTTTMRSGGSKLNKGNVRTSTFVVDSNTPSRSSSNAISRGTGISYSGGNPLNTTPNSTGPQMTHSPITTTDSNHDLRSSMVGSTRSNTGASGLSQGKSFAAVELPGSRPDGYESEEEVVMSATAYPGQEWMPEYAVGTSWDD